MSPLIRPLRSLANGFGLAWWARVETTGPDVTYWFGPFLSRSGLESELSTFLDDISSDGMDLIEDIRNIFDNYDFGTEILAASVRGPMHVIECAKLGADVMTGPLSAIMGLMKHPLTDSGLAKFLEDHAKANG